MGIKESALAAVTSITDADFIRIVTSAGASRKILLPNLLPIAKNANGHNSVFRGKSLGSSISTAQNQAIKDRVYTDMFIGDYWTINGHTWRIAAFEYYINCGDTNFTKGHLIVVPDGQLYVAPMNATNITDGAYTGSAMFTGESITVGGTTYTGLANARTIAAADFGSHVAAHRILCANAVANGKPSGWTWRNSDGIELMNEQQVYGARAWGDAAQNGYDIGTQKMQFPLFLLAPQYVNTRQNYWLHDVRSATAFAYVNSLGSAGLFGSSNALGVRPAITLSYI